MALTSSLAKRLFFGSWLIVIVVGLILLDGWLSCPDHSLQLPWWTRGFSIALVLAFLGSVGCVELSRLARARKLAPPLLPMIIVVVAVVMQPYWAAETSCPAVVWLAFPLLVGLFLGAVFQFASVGTQCALANLGLVCFSSIYLGLGCWFVLALRLLGRDSADLFGQIGPLVMFLACVKFCDIGAYFTGRFFGRHLWVPSISPAKTWEGFFGGLVLSMIVASLFSAFSAIIGMLEALAFGLMIGLVGQLGDLLESMLKRDAAMKDSARVIPEFGGVLDLLDSVIVAAPVAYLMFSVFASAG